MSAAGTDVLLQLFLGGPLPRGRITSAIGLAETVEAGTVEVTRDGWVALTPSGILACLRGGFGPRKEALLRRSDEAVAESPFRYVASAPTRVAKVVVGPPTAIADGMDGVPLPAFLRRAIS